MVKQDFDEIDKVYKWGVRALIVCAGLVAVGFVAGFVAGLLFGVSL